MNIEKIFEYKEKLQENLSFEEISKLYREILYNEYEKLVSEKQVCNNVLIQFNNIRNTQIELLEKE